MHNRDLIFQWPISTIGSFKLWSTTLTTLIIGKYPWAFIKYMVHILLLITEEGYFWNGENDRMVRQIIFANILKETR